MKYLVLLIGDGELKHGLKVKAHAFSKSALEKIKKAGGSAEAIAVRYRPRTAPKDPQAAADVVLDSIADLPEWLGA